MIPQATAERCPHKEKASLLCLHQKTLRWGHTGLSTQQSNLRKSDLSLTGSQKNCQGFLLGSECSLHRKEKGLPSGSQQSLHILHTQQVYPMAAPLLGKPSLLPCLASPDCPFGCQAKSSNKPSLTLSAVCPLCSTVAGGHISQNS